MTKPMYCPMSFASLPPYAPIDHANVCTPDCALAGKRWDSEKHKYTEYGCQLATLGEFRVNTRPLKDDAE